jgi:isoaspartyl peptidase/L-asparaginase-like protein (Ntn-hydrolase superfamily)
VKSKGAGLSSEKSISKLIKAFGKNVGGIITIDRSGSFGISNNTASMPNGYISFRDEKSCSFLNP